jgi:hypothetical protein
MKMLMDNLIEKYLWVMFQEYLSKKRLDLIKMKLLLQREHNLYLRKKLKKELKHKKLMQSKLECYKKLLMKRKNYESL